MSRWLRGPAYPQQRLPGCTLVLPVVIICYGAGRYLRHVGGRQLRRLEAGECMACGYDLRGTLAAGKTECPECGAAVDANVYGRAVPSNVGDDLDHSG